MKLTIGENLRALRRERDVTQEELAEILGVSCQSVSRWEKGVCYPDVELVPELAAFFGVTTDYLMGVGQATEDAYVKGAEEEFQQALSRGEVCACIRIAREGVRTCPNNYRLQLLLMYALFLSGDEEGNIPEWRENRQKYDEEIVSLGERILKYCQDQYIRLEATALLADHYCETGRRRQGRALYETLPRLKQCRETRIWWALEPEERLPFLQKTMRNAYSIIMSAIYRMTGVDVNDDQAGLLPDEEALAVYEKRFALDEVLTDGATNTETWRFAADYWAMARCLARLGRKVEALARLEQAAQSVAEFDVRPEKTVMDSLLLGKWVSRRTDYGTTDSRPMAEVFRDKWLADPAFDALREEPRFLALLEPEQRK